MNEKDLDLMSDANCIFNMDEPGVIYSVLNLEDYPNNHLWVTRLYDPAKDWEDYERGLIE